MRKVGLILSILLLFVLVVSLTACAQPEPDPNNILAEDGQYSLDYEEGVTSCNMSLDGAGNCTIKRKIDYEKPLSEETEDLYRITFISSSRSFDFQYRDDYLNLTNRYVFTTQNNLEYYDSTKNASQSFKTFANSIDGTYQMSYNLKVADMDATVTITMKPVQGTNNAQMVAMGYKIEAAEETYAQGSYSIYKNKYVKLKFEYSLDNPPKKGLANYQNAKLGTEYTSNLIIEEGGRENGLVHLSTQGSNLYVQLRDDGSFSFVRAATTISSEDCFTKTSYNSQSFTTRLMLIDGAELYTYEYQLSFDSQGKATISCTLAESQKNYAAKSAEELEVIAYDAEVYDSLIGTHRQLGTSNNLSLANTYIVYADYNYSRYTFEGNLNILLFKLDNYTYLKTNNARHESIAAKFYDDGTWEWIETEFIGIDFSVHDEDEL